MIKNLRVYYCNKEVKLKRILNSIPVLSSVDLLFPVTTWWFVVEGSVFIVVCTELKVNIETAKIVYFSKFRIHYKSDDLSSLL